MSISKDLLLAILSMDSYNRGYEAGITDGLTGVGKDIKEVKDDDPDGLGDSSDGSIHIGPATIKENLDDAGIATQAQSAGFYAIAYKLDKAVEDLPAHTTIISYRGTDCLRGTGVDPRPERFRRGFNPARH